MTDLPERPFFVIGNPRSGTTLLRFILSSHPRLHIPAETGFLPFLGFDADAILAPVEARTVLTRIGRLNREWAGLVEDVEALYRELPEPTLARLLDALYRVQIAEHGAVRWGDKTPSYVLHLDRLDRIFSTAQFVHVIRDGRDATLSARAKWGRRRWYMDNYYLLRNWVRHVDHGRQAGRKLPADRYLEIRYEGLVQHPERVVKEICAFLGETFCPEMLNHTQLAREQIGPRGHVEVREPISTASVQRWKTQMSNSDKRLADRVAGPTLAACGYELSGLGLPTGGDRLRFLLLSCKYALIQAGRQALTRLGWLTLNRGKRRRRV
jgi:hypothetical protein